jgi:hypothetical protein
MRTMKVIVYASLLVAIVISLYLIPRSGYCRRCGDCLTMIGPFVVAVMGGGLVGGEGDPELYCTKHGHVFTFLRSRARTLNDWQHQRDSYESEAAFLPCNLTPRGK